MTKSDPKICFERSKYILYQPYPGLHLAYHANRFYYSRRSRFQQIDIIENDAYGRMLFLDGNLQHTAYDAALFNEALCGRVKRDRVRSVIVLGGGSGQTLISLLQSKQIREITLVEIDPMLVEACSNHIRGAQRAFKDQRVRIRFANAFTYLSSMDEKYDAAIIDLTERPLRMKNTRSTLTQAYLDIREKCGARCSQYVGSSVGLANNGRSVARAREVSRKILRRVEVENVFIPSFGAPHTFIHAGLAI